MFYALNNLLIQLHIIIPFGVMTTPAKPGDVES